MNTTEKINALITASNTATGGSATDLTTAISALISGYGAGGGLPEGMATGTFQCTPANMNKEVSIEHGLGAVPRYVIAFIDSGYATQNADVLFALTYNNSSCPVSKSIAYSGDGSPSVVDFLGTKTADTSTNAYLPASSSAWFFLTHTYRWIAIL